MKKLLSLILAGSMLFSLAACGGSSESKDDAVNTDSPNDVVNNGSASGEDSSVEIGDYIKFGKYEQDNDLSNGKEDIEWVVLDEQDGKLLVISRYELDSQVYHETNQFIDVTWETCTLRSWLNNNFYNEAFTKEEQNSIQTTTVIAEDNPTYETDAGDDTQDKLFLLSISEVKNYIVTDAAKYCWGTEYAEALGATGWWWLRTPGKSQSTAATVTMAGEIIYYGNNIFTTGNGVRPAMWIEL